MNREPDETVRILNASLVNFRHYTDTEVNLDADLIIFTGENGSGKTTILEAVSICSMLRSFRTGTDRDIISWDHSYYNVRLTYRAGSRRQTLHVGYGRHPDSNSDKKSRSLKIDSEKINRVSDFIGRFYTVVFSPDDTDIVDTTPAERRRFVDMQLSSLYPAYLSALQKYNRLLKQKSELLRSRGQIEPLYIESLNRELADHGSVIQSHREQFLSEFDTPFNEYVKRISGGNDRWNIAYKPSIEGGSDKKQFLDELNRNITRDIQTRQNLSGIHRDRISFHIPGRPAIDLKQTASQGQKRTVALSLKMAQYTHTRDKKHEKPVLLIDDVFNELDINRRKRFVEFLSEIGQAIVTTTDLEGLKDFIEARKSSISILLYHINKADSEIRPENL